MIYFSQFYSPISMAMCFNNDDAGVPKGNR